MSTYRQVVGEVIHLVDLHGPMSLRQLAELLDVSADEIRRQVEAYSYEDASAPDWVPGLVAVFVEPLDEEDPPVPSDDDRVRIVGHPDRLVLGIERFGASVFGPLYDAAADLSAREPENAVLAGACRKLLDVFLPGVRPRSTHQADALAQLESAIQGTLTGAHHLLARMGAGDRRARHRALRIDPHRSGAGTGRRTRAGRRPHPDLPDQPDPSG